MINRTLYFYQMKKNVKPWLVLCAVLTLYIVLIVRMYDPEMMAMLEGFYKAMPELMSAVGMQAQAGSLIEFLISYLYGFLLVLLPMIYTILSTQGAICHYVDTGSMAALLAAPLSRRKLLRTQWSVIFSGLFLLILYCTLCELLSVYFFFPDEHIFFDVLVLNGSLFILHLFIASLCFFLSVYFDESSQTIGVSIALTGILYVIKMLDNVIVEPDFLGYCTYFSLFDPQGLIQQDSIAWMGIGVLLVGSIFLLILSKNYFVKKDLSI